MDFIESCVEDAGITRVLLLCKSHLDIGFTDYSSVVRSQYLEQYIPRIIRMSHQSEEGGKENIVWCSGSYIAYEYWRSVKGAALQDFEEALRKGVIGYHALPFTSHSELYDASLFASLLKDCRELDEVSGRRTRAAKMTDVPGHCCGIVPVLAAGGVEFLHLGINPASYVPEIPQFFRWRVQGHELTVMFAGTDYSADATLPDGRTRLVFMHGGDNSAPPSFGLIRQYFRELRLRYPNAVVSMGSLEDLADLVLPYRGSFPVIESEIGDSWIHGLATDCVKTSRFRELLRFRRSHDGKEVPREFDQQLAMTGEHTWGMDIKTHLSDDEIWMRPDFDGARRTQANFVTVEKSWEEQRAYIDGALAALPEALRREADAALESLKPAAWEFSAAVAEPPQVKTERFCARFDASGNLVELSDPTGELDYGVSSAGFMNVRYHAYGRDEMFRYLKEYCPWKGSAAQVSWAAWDMGKMGIPAQAPSGAFAPVNPVFTVDDSDGGVIRVRVRLEWEKALRMEAGAPCRLEVEYAFDRHAPLLDVTVQWFDKPANRLPEALIAHFGTTYSAAAQWRMHKMGLSLNPADVVCGGGTGIHAVDSDVSLTAAENGTLFSLSSPDVPLLLPDDREMWHYSPEAARPSGKFAFCISNNQWGTNFPQWCDDDFRCRFHFTWQRLN